MSVGVSGSEDKGPPSPGKRLCCMLTPEAQPVGEQVVDTTKLGPYKLDGGDVVGIVYTCRGGFIDFAHLRDLVGLTYYYHHALTKGGANVVGKKILQYPIIGRPPLGGVTIKKNVPAADRIDVAASMAFDQSVFYEIETYWQDDFVDIGMHHSAFSPEDLVSNFIGTHIATRALRLTTIPFEKAVTQELNAVINLLQPLTKEKTKEAFALIEGSWVTSFDLSAQVRQNYLRRRNFNYTQITPCYVAAQALGCPDAPTFPSEIPRSYPASISSYYDVDYKVEFKARRKLGEIFSKSRFASEIAKMKTDAEARYGTGFQCGT